MPNNQRTTRVAREPELNGFMLRAVRREMSISQETLAALLRKAGAELGEPNGCTKRLVQKWEKGEHRRVQPNYQRAIETVTGVPFAWLCSEGHALAVTLPGRLDRIISDLTVLRAELDELN